MGLQHLDLASYRWYFQNSLLGCNHIMISDSPATIRYRSQRLPRVLLSTQPSVSESYRCQVGQISCMQDSTRFVLGNLVRIRASNRTARLSLFRIQPPVGTAYYTCFEWKVCAWCMFINQSPRNCHRQFGPVCKSRLCSQSVRFFYLWIHLQELSRMVCLSKWSGPYDVIPAPQWSKIASPKIFILA